MFLSTSRLILKFEDEMDQFEAEHLKLYVKCRRLARYQKPGSRLHHFLQVNLFTYGAQKLDSSMRFTTIILERLIEKHIKKQHEPMTQVYR